jgi:lycopene cyclase domain-containing protein
VIHYAYLLALLVSFAGVAAWDLTKGRSRLRAVSGRMAIVVPAVILLGADMIGIRLGIFETNPAYVSGLFLWSRNMPVEEPTLLLFIAFFSLVARDVIDGLAR